MDGKLAVRWRGDISFKWFLQGSFVLARPLACPVHVDPMAQALTTKYPRDHPDHHQPVIHATREASSNLFQGYTRLRLDDSTICHGNWKFDCQITALPVLLLDSLDDTISPVARRCPSCFTICSFLCAGVCMERVPQHEL